MGQLQSKPAKLGTVSLLLRFSEGNACPCKSCHFRFLGISLGGVRKKRECSLKRECSFVIKMLIYLQISTTVYVQGQFMSHFQRKNG